MGVILLDLTNFELSVDFTEKITKIEILNFYFSNHYYYTHGHSRRILTCNMNSESPNTLVFIVYKEFVQKIFQTTKIGKNMSLIFFTHPLGSTMSKTIFDQGNAEQMQQNVHVWDFLKDWWEAQI